MKKTLLLRAEHLAELTTAELDNVVGASGLTCTDLPPTVDINTCRSIPNCR
jgi:hypothetical protein